MSALRARLIDAFVLSPRATRWLLAATLALIALGWAASPSASPVAPSALAAEQGDAALYRAIDQRLRSGQGYYPAAVVEQRARDYPLRPFVTVRLPTRARLYALAGSDAAQWLLRALALTTLVLTATRLVAAAGSVQRWGAATAIATLSILPLATPVVALWPECWAGLLVALSLALRTDRRWSAAVVVGLSAALFRELTLPYLAAMALAALSERRRGEALAWAGAAIVAALALAAHAAAVAGAIRPDDAASQGWVRAGGWTFDLAMARTTTPLALLPATATAVLVPLAMYGWATAPGVYARRVTLTLLAWLVPALIVGRPENSYWGLMLAPLWLAGLPLARARLHHAHGRSPCLQLRAYLSLAR